MLKPVINANDAVRRVRDGASDEELMREYEISARGLESLFKKLLDANLLANFELEQRRLRSQRSHMVSLFDLPVLEPRTAVIDPEDAVTAIRAGLSDERLMKEYNLSARGLESLFRHLIKEDFITEVELDGLRPRYERAEIRVEPLPELEEIPEPTEEEPLFETLYPKPASRAQRIKTAHWAAMGGFAVGVAAVLLFILITGKGADLVGGLFSWAEGHDSYAEVGVTEDFDQFVAILKSIEREAENRGETDSVETAAGYRKCLESCESLAFAHDDEDRALVNNCRHRCVAQHDEHFKRIRRRFSTNPFVVKELR